MAVGPPPNFPQFLVFQGAYVFVFYLVFYVDSKDLHVSLTLSLYFSFLTFFC